MKKYMILLVASLLIGACGKDDNDTPDVPQDAERTVLIYMGADNNLASLANQDFKELKESSKLLNDRQNLIVFLDNGDNDVDLHPFIARIKNGVVVDSIAINGDNTADPAVLEEILDYTLMTYPAKSYGLVLWGHADGWLISNDSVAYTRAYGVDTGQSKSYWMNIPSMARAIANGMGVCLRAAQGDRLSDRLSCRDSRPRCTLSYYRSCHVQHQHDFLSVDY